MENWYTVQQKITEFQWRVFFYKNEGKYTKQAGPAPELKKYEPFLVLWIKEYKKLGFPVLKRRLARERSKNFDFNKTEMKERNKKIGNSNEKTEEIWRKKNSKRLKP